MPQQSKEYQRQLVWLQPQLTNLAGDMGARQVFMSLDRTKTVRLPESDALDIDTTEDLARATGTLSA